MDYKEIEQLLERYWQCETSVEEESVLRDFFSKEDIPAHLLCYKDFFVYQQVQRETVKLGDDFDDRILAELKMPVVKIRRVTWKSRFIPLFNAVAVVAIVFFLGNVVRHSFSNKDESVLAMDTIGKQVTTPSVAITNDVKNDQMLTDSLAKISQQVQIIEE